VPPADPRTGETLGRLAQSLQAQSNAQQAVALYREIGRPYRDELLKKRAADGDTPGIVSGLVDIGYSLDAAGELAEAERVFRDVLQMRRKLFGEASPDTIESLKQLTRFLRKQGRTGDAEALWTDTVELRQKFLATEDPAFRAGAYLGVVRPMFECGQVDQAKAFCRTALQMNVNSLSLLDEDAWLLVTCAEPRRDPELAVELATRGVQLAPKAAKIRSTLGMALYRAGKFSAAIEELKLAVQLNPQNPAPSDFLFLAMAYQKAGDAVAARQWHDKALALNIHATQNIQLRRFIKEAEQVLSGDRPATSRRSTSRP
jgi:tetratricopeptide (TPR) repeat protein